MIAHMPHLGIGRFMGRLAEVSPGSRDGACEASEPGCHEQSELYSGAWASRSRQHRDDPDDLCTGVFLMSDPEGTPPTPESTADIISRNYPVIRRMALARSQGRGMSPSSLAQETVCRLLKQPAPPATEDHLHAAAWKIMEWVMVDRARSEHARERREHGREPAPARRQSLDPRIVAVSEAMQTLTEHSPRKAEAFSLWAVCGLSIERIAAMLEISTKTVQRDLDFAKAWVAARIGSKIGPRA